MKHLIIAGLMMGVLLFSASAENMTPEVKEKLYAKTSVNFRTAKLSAFADWVRKKTGLKVTVLTDDVTLTGGNYDKLPIGSIIKTTVKKSGLSVGYTKEKGIVFYRKSTDAAKPEQPSNKEGFPEVMLHSRVYLKDDQSTVDPTYISTLANTSSWKSVLSRNPHLYFFQGRLGERESTDEVLSQLARIVQDNKLRVSVEVGGLRFVNAAAFNDRSGERHAGKELKKLLRWTKAGGPINEITTDHAIMHHIAMNHRDKEFRHQKTVPLPEDKKHLKFTWDGLYNELMDYFLTVKEKIPDCAFGCVSSPGYFTFSDESGVKYGPKGLPAWEFSDYVDGLLATAKKKGVTITHIDVDSSYTGTYLAPLLKKPSRKKPRTKKATALR